MSEDKRLERIYDYTKWHIGIYFTVTGALAAGMSYLAQKPSVGRTVLFEHPWLLLLATGFMFLAGLCGAIVASSCTECVTYHELWNEKHGPYGWKLFPGRHWARCEHTFFWMSASSLILFVFSSSVVLQLLQMR